MGQPGLAERGGGGKVLGKFYIFGDLSSRAGSRGGAAGLLWAALSPPAALLGSEGDLQNQTLPALGFGSSGGRCCRGGGMARVSTMAQVGTRAALSWPDYS